ncbi:hypothetical protein ACLB2K_056411 [Fragaria x ananassa]
MTKEVSDAVDYAYFEREFKYHVSFLSCTYVDWNSIASIGDVGGGEGGGAVADDDDDAFDMFGDDEPVDAAEPGLENNGGGLGNDYVFDDASGYYYSHSLGYYLIQIQGCIARLCRGCGTRTMLRLGHMMKLHTRHLRPLQPLLFCPHPVNLHRERKRKREYLAGISLDSGHRPPDSGHRNFSYEEEEEVGEGGGGGAGEWDDEVGLRQKRRRRRRRRRGPSDWARQKVDQEEKVVGGDEAAEDDREVSGKRLFMDVGLFEDGLVDVHVLTIEKVPKKKGRPVILEQIEDSTLQGEYSYIQERHETVP